MDAKNVGKVINVLVVDEMVAHYALLKSNYAHGRNYDITFFSKFKFDDLAEFIAEKEIDMAFVFVYGRKSLHRVLPFLAFDLEIILFTNERDLWWLSESLPQINLVDIALPKGQLFTAIDHIIQRLRAEENLS
tara:strand:+ start:45106 stop:45504 length:399 start_codon:yes stop_codon:yes gene_type:complete